MNPLAGNLQVREDLKRGVFIDGISEETTTSAEEAIEILNKGARNRHVGATEMNNESSRSHSVFTLTIESKRIIEGVTNVKSSKFHFVDLAGSERQKQTASVGTRLKEAGNINKSLTVLGSVINALVDISSGKKTHIRYRDSKLTFLLKDSLGGNSKTAMIANVSPASINFSETLSTLKFAQRAKLIKNKASINEELTGSIDVLRKEITRLKRDLQAAQSGNYGGSTLSNGDPMSSNFNGQSSSIMPETIERVQKELVEHNSLQLDLETMLQETVSLIDSSQAIADSEKLKTEKIKAIHEQASSIGERREKQLRMMVELYEEKIRRLGYGAWSEVEEKDATARENVVFCDL